MEDFAVENEELCSNDLFDLTTCTQVNFTGLGPDVDNKPEESCERKENACPTNGNEGVETFASLMDEAALLDKEEVEDVGEARNVEAENAATYEKDQFEWVDLTLGASVDTVKSQEVAENSDVENAGKITEILKMKDHISSTLMRIKQINTMKQRMENCKMVLEEVGQKTVLKNDTGTADKRNKRKQKKKEVREAVKMIEKTFRGQSVDKSKLQKIGGCSKKPLKVKEDDNAEFKHEGKEKESETLADSKQFKEEKSVKVKEKQSEAGLVIKIRKTNVDACVDQDIANSDEIIVDVYMMNEKSTGEFVEDGASGTAESICEVHSVDAPEEKVKSVHHDVVTEPCNSIKELDMTSKESYEDKVLKENTFLSYREKLHKEMELFRKETREASLRSCSSSGTTENWKGDLAETVRKIKEIQERLRERNRRQQLLEEKEAKEQERKNSDSKVLKENDKQEKGASCNEDNMDDEKWVCCRKKNKAEGGKEKKKKKKKNVAKPVESPDKPLNEIKAQASTRAKINNVDNAVYDVSDANQALEHLIEDALELDSDEGSPVPRIPSVFSEIDKVLFRIPNLELEPDSENQTDAPAEKQEKINRSRVKSSKSCKTRKKPEQGKTALEERDHLAKKVEQLSKLLNLLRIIASIIDCEQLMEEKSQLGLPDKGNSTATTKDKENSPDTHSNQVSVPQSLEEILLLAELDRADHSTELSDSDLKKVEDYCEKNIKAITSGAKDVGENSSFSDTLKAEEIKRWKEQVSASLSKLRKIKESGWGSQQGNAGTKSFPDSVSEESKKESALEVGKVDSSSSTKGNKNGSQTLVVPDQPSEPVTNSNKS